MKILVTGANGFIGRHLVAALTRRFPQAKIAGLGLACHPPNVTGQIVCDLADEKKTKETVLAFAPDQVYHLAGSARVSQSVSLPEYFSKNFLTTMNVVSAIEQMNRPVSFLFASSVHVYGNQEGVITEETPRKPISPYGFTKYLAEEGLRAKVAECPRLKVVVARLYNCIGPGQPEGFVAADLCKKVASLSSTPDTVMEVGSLTTYRQFLDVRDAVSLFPDLLSSAHSPGHSLYEAFNIGSLQSFQIKEILELLVKISGKKPKVVSLEEQQGNRFLGLNVNIEKLRKTIPNPKFRPIEESLRDMYQSTKSSPLN